MLANNVHSSNTVAIAATTHLNTAIINNLKSRQANVAQAPAINFAAIIDKTSSATQHNIQEYFHLHFGTLQQHNSALYKLVYSIILGSDELNSNSTLTLSAQLNYLQFLQTKYLNTNIANKSHEAKADENSIISQPLQFELFQLFFYCLLATSAPAIQVSKSISNSIVAILNYTAQARKHNQTAASYLIKAVFFNELQLNIANNSPQGLAQLSYENLIWLLDFIFSHNYLNTEMLQLLASDSAHYFDLLLDWVNFHLGSQIEQNLIHAQANLSNAMGNEESKDLDGSNAHLFGSNQACKEILRVLIRMTLKFKVAFRAYCQTNDNSHLSNTPKAILESLCSILLNSWCYHKDALTQAGFIVGLFIQHSSADLSILQPYWRLLLDLSPSTASNTFASPILSLIYSKLHSTPHKLNRISYLSLYRALLSHGLAQECKLLDGSNLLFALFPLISRHCESSNPHLRFYAFQTLELWLREFRQILANINPEENSPQNNAKLAEILENYTNKTLLLLQPNFEHPLRVIVTVVKEIFAAFVQTKALSRTFLGQRGRDSGENTWIGFVKQLLGPINEASLRSATRSYEVCSEYISSRPIYHQVLCLLPHVNNYKLLEALPGLVSLLFNAAQHRTVYNLANNTLLELLRNVKAEMRAEWERNHEEKTENQERNKKKHKHQRLKDSKRAAQMAKEAAESSAASAFINSTQDEPDYAVRWRELWLRPLLSCLFHDSELVRGQVSSCTLVALLSNDSEQAQNSGNLSHLLRALAQLDNQQENCPVKPANRFRALILVLKAARKNGLIGTKEITASLDHSKQNPSSTHHISTLIPLRYEQFYESLLSSDAGFRLDCFELLCSNSARAELASDIEIKLFKDIFPLVIKINSSIPNIRTRFIHFLQRFLIRIRDSVNRAIKDDLVTQSSNLTQQQLNEFQLLQLSLNNSSTNQFCGLKRFLSESMQTKLFPSIEFIHWLESYLMSGLYPGAPFERSAVTLELYQLTMQLFTQGNHPNLNVNVQLEEFIWALHDKFFTQSRVDTLFNCLISGWEKVRLSSYAVLSLFPTNLTLPGYNTIAQLKPIIEWAFSLLRSYRLRDCEAGAFLFKLIANKYCKHLRWIIPLRRIILKEAAVEELELAASGHSAQLYLINEFSSILRSSVHNFIPRALASLSIPSQAVQFTDSPLLTTNFHGFLLAMRYIMQDCEWREQFDRSFSELDRAEWRKFAAELIDIQITIAQQSLQLQKHTMRKDTVKEDEEERNMEEDEENSEDEEESEEQLDFTFDCRGHIILPSDKNSIANQSEEAALPAVSVFSNQLLVVSLWLGVKEVSLILGTAVELAPLPNDKQSTAGIFDYSQLLRIGQLYLSILLSSKHNGVLEKCHVGFGLVCRRLLYSNELFLHEIVEMWLKELISKIASTTSDLWIRRSRGVVFAFMAILKAELPGNTRAATANSTSILRTNKHLFHQTMPALLTEAQRAMHAPDNSSLSWKYIVHVLNIMRSIYRDSELNIDGMIYSNQAFQLAILGFSHAQWAVRNAALLMFGSLLIKALRLQYLNQANSTAAQSLTRSLTGLELFSQLPGFHSFLINQLKLASVDTDNSIAMHPSLYPVLLLLSKLTAAQAEANPLQLETLLANPYPYIHEQFHFDSFVATALSQSNSMYLFLPSILRCLSHRVYMARFMASEALVSLIPVQKQQTFILALIASLPKAAKFGGNDQPNSVHGVLAAVKELLFAIPSTDSLQANIDRINFIRECYMKLFGDSAWLFGLENGVPILKILALEICYFILSMWKKLAVKVFQAQDIQNHPFNNLIEKLIYFTLLNCDSPSSGTDFTGVGSDSLRNISAQHFLAELFGVDSTSRSFPHKILSEKLRSNIPAIVQKFLADRSESIIQTTMKAIRLAVNQYENFCLADIPLDSHAAQYLFQFNSNGCCLAMIFNYFVKSYKLLNITNQRLALQIIVKLLNIQATSKDNSYSIINDSLISNDFWDMLHANILAVDELDAGLKSYANVLVGIIIKQLSMSRSQDGAQVLHNRLSDWIQLMCKYIDDDSPAELRLSCSRAIQSSQLFCNLHSNQFISLQSSSIFPLWPIMLSSLQDQSEIIRIQTAQTLGQLVTQSSNSTLCSSNNTLIVSYMLEWLVKSLFQSIASSPKLRLQLIQFLFEPLISCINLQSIFAAEDSDQYKLFRKEKSNKHSEQLLIIQLNLIALNHILNTNASADFADNEVTALKCFNQQFVATLIECVQNINKQSAIKSEAVAGSFLYSFELSVALYALSSSIAVLTQFFALNGNPPNVPAAQLESAIKALAQFPFHPTITQALKQLESSFNQTKFSIELSGLLVSAREVPIFVKEK
jgi:hypothetical protein